MTAANQQVINAFEQLGMSPEEIAEDQDLDIVAVKSILAQFSSLFRKQAKGDKDASVGFTEDQHQMAVDVIAQLAAYSEDERVKLRAAQFIRDDKKGRRDLVNMAGLNINVLTFNQTMQKALAAKNRAKNAEVLNVEKVDKQLTE